MLFSAGNCCRALYVIICVTMIQLTLYSQSTTAVKSIVIPPKVKYLAVGDIIPNVTLSNLHNYTASRVSLPGFQKGRYMILDFWSTWCAACIAAFPKMHKYKELFKDSLEILLVNAKTSLDTEAKVSGMMRKRKERTGMDVTLPYVVEETAISPFFRYKFIPHYVWVNPDGSIYAITGADEATQDNVAAFVRGQNPILHMKEDAFNYDTNLPLFVNNNGGNGNDFEYRSILTKYKEGLGGTAGRQVDTVNKTIRNYYLNQSVRSLYGLAYGDKIMPFNNRLFFPDSLFKEKFLHPEKPDSRYCYELIVPMQSIEGTSEYLKQDLERVFKMRAKKVVQPMKCIVITGFNEAAKLASTHAQTYMQTSEAGEEKKMFKIDFETIVAVLNTIAEIPIVAEVNLPGKLDFTIPADVATTQALINYLKSKGFILAELVRDIPVTIFEQPIPQQ